MSYEQFLNSARAIFDKKGMILLSRSQWQGYTDSLTLHFEGYVKNADLPHFLEETPRFRGSVTCTEIDLYQISTNEIYKFDFPVDHPLLWEWWSDEKTLFFTGKPQDINSLIIDLYKIQNSFTRWWLPQQAFLNAGSLESLIALLEGGHGVLAKAPEPLLKRYAAELEKQGCKVSILGEVSSRADGQVDTWPYRVFIFESSFVIAEEFDFKIETATI
jgi:hypothetical protein